MICKIVQHESEYLSLKMMTNLYHLNCSVRTSVCLFVCLNPSSVSSFRPIAMAQIQDRIGQDRFSNVEGSFKACKLIQCSSHWLVCNIGLVRLRFATHALRCVIRGYLQLTYHLLKMFVSVKYKRRKHKALGIKPTEWECKAQSPMK